jgi:hypothetical protein
MLCGDDERARLDLLWLGATNGSEECRRVEMGVGWSASMAHDTNWLCRHGS